MDTRSTDLHFLELNELADLIREREVSPVLATRLQLDRIAGLDDALASYAFVAEENAMAEARAAEGEIAAGHYRGPLHGVPIAVKDLLWTKGLPMTAGTAIHRSFRPTEDATVVRRLREAGAVILGKLQMTEGAYSDHHPSVTPPKNPWHEEYWTGISSSGAGAATAAGLCYGAIGSDTAGSIRWPSVANGLTGLKPTWGRVSRYGAFELAASLDHIGPMARSAVDAAILLGAIAGSDDQDPTALDVSVPNYHAALETRGQRLRIGVDVAWSCDDVDSQTQSIQAKAMSVFQSLGAEIIDVKVPDVTQAITDWFPACAFEAARAHAATYPSRQGEYGPALASALDAGRAVSADAHDAIRFRRATLRGHIDCLFRTIDLLLTPVQPFAAPTLDMMRRFVEEPDRVSALLRFTSPFNMTGHPALVMAGGFTEAGLPVGIQLVGTHLGETTLLRAGAAFQTVTSWHRRHPTCAVSWKGDGHE